MVALVDGMALILTPDKYRELTERFEAFGAEMTIVQARNQRENWNEVQQATEWDRLETMRRDLIRTLQSALVQPPSESLAS